MLYTEFRITKTNTGTTKISQVYGRSKVKMDDSIRVIGIIKDLCFLHIIKYIKIIVNNTGQYYKG